MPFNLACGLNGVPVATAAEWLARGQGTHAEREQTKNTAYFAKVIAQARAVIAQRMIESVRKAAEGTKNTDPDWRAAAFYLGRMVHDFKDKKDLGLSEGDNGPVKEVVKVEIVMPKDEE